MAVLTNWAVLSFLKELCCWHFLQPKWTTHSLDIALTYKPQHHVTRRELQEAGKKLVVVEVQSEQVCMTGLEEEAELHWKQDKIAALQPCVNIKHTFQRTARECKDVVFVSLQVCGTGCGYRWDGVIELLGAGWRGCGQASLTGGHLQGSKGVLHSALQVLSGSWNACNWGRRSGLRGVWINKQEGRACECAGGPTFRLSRQCSCSFRCCSRNKHLTAFVRLRQLLSNPHMSL